MMAVLAFVRVGVFAGAVMSAQWIEGLTFAVYLLVVLVLGAVAFARTTSLGDYILGGRRLGPWVTALSAQASDMSGWLLMGLPGLAYLAGFGAIWLPIGLAVGTAVNWQLVAPRLRRQTEALGNALTVPDYLEARFNDGTGVLRIVAALVILFFFTIYTASALVAGGKLFDTVFGLDYETAVMLGAGAILLYTALGGFFAVSWTDTLQGALMFVALVAATVTGVWLLGGFGGAGSAIERQDPKLLSVWTGGDGKAIGAVGIISLLAWGLGYFGQPHILARFMALREPKQMQRAMTIALVWVVVCLTAAVGVGMLGAAYLDLSLAGQGEAEHVFIHLVQALFHPVIAGVCLAAILAAVMSTADSQLLVASSAVAEDFYKRFVHRDASQSELVWLGRESVVAISLLALWVASDEDSAVLGLVSDAWAGFGAAFGPVLVMSLLWGGMTRAGALSGMVVGGGVVIFWIVVPQLQAAGYLGGPPASGVFDLYAMVPGFALALATIVGVSLATREPAGPGG
jgi:sodium/proline symporter